MRHLLLFLPFLLIACASAPPPQPVDPVQEKLTRLRTVNKPMLEMELAAAGFQYGNPMFIRIFKLERMLEVWMEDPLTGEYRLFKKYPICNYSGELGPKMREGDKQAPEGFYDVTLDRMHPASENHLAFNIGYPNTYDKSLKRTGSFIMVHGRCSSIGCFAMSDPQMERIYFLTEAALQNGQESVPVHIFPFRLSPENLVRARHHKWYPFWQNLAEGFQLFELAHVPPTVYQGTGYYAAYHPQYLTPAEAQQPVMQSYQGYRAERQRSGVY